MFLSGFFFAGLLWSAGLCFAASHGGKLLGDKLLPTPVPAARDDTATRLAALAVLALCAGAVTWLVRLGG